ncbi:MAG: STAS-like domain-containing protein [Chloroflexota bacterium]
MKTVAVAPIAGSFAENKDAARELRVAEIETALRDEDEVTIDFAGVELATQSFVHALISAVIRQFGPSVLDRILFVRCTEEVQRVIEIVVEYSQDDPTVDADDLAEDDPSRGVRA